MMLPQRYLFNLSFDPDEPERRPAAEAPPPAPAEPEPPPPPPPPMFSVEELTEACTRARNEARAAAQAAAMQAIEHQTLQALSRITQQFDQLLAAQQRSDAALAEQAVLLALAITRKLLPELARRRGAAEIEAVVRACLQDLLKEPRIVVRVATGLLDAMSPRIDAIAGTLGYEGAVVLLPDPALGPADCRVAWADGGAERLSDQLWECIDEAVARLLDTAPDALTLAGRPVAGRAAPAVAASA